MAFVLDASVTLAYVFSEETTPFATTVMHRLGVESAHVPSIWPLEIVNALLAAERQKRLAPSQVDGLRLELGALPVEIEQASPSGLLGLEIDAARTHGLSIYDAAYLALAIRRSIPLATLDARLQSAAKRAGIALLDG
jgi:predicted nucleic acid-binding protein